MSVKNIRKERLWERGLGAKRRNRTRETLTCDRVVLGFERFGCRRFNSFENFTIMVVRHHVDGYENFLKFMGDFKEKGLILVLYSGTKLPNGQSWCSDCVEADPFIEKGIAMAPEESHFIHVEVGDRPFWKDPKCPFRTNFKTKLNVLPTLAIWGTQKRLEGEQCLDVELIEMLINEEDD